MILSMTGFGGAERTDQGVCYSLEIRCLNHRYLKVTIKLPETLQFLEGKVEPVVRERLARGSISYTIRARSDTEAVGYEINAAALQKYVNDICAARIPETLRASVDLATLAALPGVCQPTEADDAARERLAEIVRGLTNEALSSVAEMRAKEGQALRSDLLDCCEGLRSHLEAIAEKAPTVVVDYQQRLQTRVQNLVAEAKLELDQDALVREVAIYADRCDISEEIARLRSHLDQFAALCDSADPAGRKLDFLAQEMLREANTIGSKGNDGTIARHIVEVKARIDRLKEQVQNVV